MNIVRAVVIIGLFVLRGTASAQIKAHSRRPA
jgi:hypothetical protein